MQQSPVVLYFCLRKSRPGKSRGSPDPIVFEKVRFLKNGFRPHENSKSAFSNSSGLKSIFKKLSFRDGLLWTVGLTVEIKLYACLNSSGVVWTESGANHDVNMHHQTKGLMSKTIAVHVRFKSLYISLPSSAKQQR